MKKILFNYTDCMCPPPDFINITIDINKNGIVDYYVTGEFYTSKKEGSLDKDESQRFINLINESKVEYWNDYYEDEIVVIDGPAMKAIVVNDDNKIIEVSMYLMIENKYMDKFIEALSICESSILRVLPLI